jgi:hypothetical protein
MHSNASATLIEWMVYLESSSGMEIATRGAGLVEQNLLAESNKARQLPWLLSSAARASMILFMYRDVGFWVAELLLELVLRQVSDWTSLEPEWDAVWDKIGLGVAYQAGSGDSAGVGCGVRLLTGQSFAPDLVEFDQFHWHRHLRGDCCLCRSGFMEGARVKSLISSWSGVGSVVGTGNVAHVSW